MISHTFTFFKMPYIKIFQAPNPLRWSSPPWIQSQSQHQHLVMEKGRWLSWANVDINVCGSLRCTARRATWVCTGTSKEVPHINPHEAFPTLELMFCLILKRTSRVKSVFTMDYNSLNRDSQVTCSASWAALENWVKLLEQKCEPDTEAGSKSNSTFLGLFCVPIVPCWKSVLFYLKIHSTLLFFFGYLLEAPFPRPAIQKRAANSYLLIRSI